MHAIGISRQICTREERFCLTQQDEPRRPRRLGKATAIDGVGLPRLIGRGSLRCYREFAKRQARSAKEEPTAQETGAEVLNDSRSRSGSPLGHRGRARTLPKPPERRLTHVALRNDARDDAAVYGDLQVPRPC